MGIAIRSDSGAATSLAPPLAAVKLADLVRTARPRQWAKNVLVLAAPSAAGVMAQPQVAVRALGAAAAFCLASSGTYFVNDAYDVEADRRHPIRRNRPVAAGLVPAEMAKRHGLMMWLAGLFVAAVVGDWRLVGVLALYIGLQPMYTLWLKRVPVADLAVVASGFALRAIAGGIAVNVRLTPLFLVVMCFGSLLVVAGKRLADAERPSDSDLVVPTQVRPCTYPTSFLRDVRSLAATVTVTAYCLWALERSTPAASPIWFQLSIIPFVMALLRYRLLLDSGFGSAPEDLFLGDRQLQVLGFMWALVFAVGVYSR